MEEQNVNPAGEEEYVETGASSGNKNEVKLSVGMLVLIGGIMWAVLELVKAVMYFFN